MTGQSTAFPAFRLAHTAKLTHTELVTHKYGVGRKSNKIIISILA